MDRLDLICYAIASLRGLLELSTEDDTDPTFEMASLFEGDRVKGKYTTGHELTGEIKLVLGGFAVRSEENGINYPLIYCVAENFEVIGNTIINPELLSSDDNP
jgi:hypothetical protein